MRDALLAELPQPEFIHFVVSFCMNGDDLPVWRSYGGDAGGFAIGVDPQAIRAPSGYRRSAAGGPVIYDERSIRELLLPPLQECEQRFVEFGQLRPNGGAQQHAISCVRYVAQMLSAYSSPLLKPTAYSYEREHRFMLSLPRDYDFSRFSVRLNASRTALVPYIEAPIRSAIREIVLGPKLSSNRAAKRVLTQLLERYEMTNIAIRRSSIHFR